MRYDVLGPDDLTVCSPLLCPSVKASHSHDVTRRKQQHIVASDKAAGEREGELVLFIVHR